MNLANWYTRLRGSRAFLFGLLTFIGSWVSLHFGFGWDAEWGGLNLILSSEASIALAFFTMMAERQDVAQRKMDERMLHLLEAMHAVLDREIEKRREP